MRWKLANITGKQHASHKDTNGNWIVSCAPSIAIFSPENKNRFNYNQLLIYQSDQGFTAYLTGKEGKTVTDQLPQDRWEEIHSAALAAFVIIGRVPDNYWQEII